MLIKQRIILISFVESIFMKKHIPNSLTLLNLFSGCCGIIAAMQQQYIWVPIIIGISLVADFLDGFVARALHVKSELGGQLDSLADMVTFGVLPGVLLFNVIGSSNSIINKHCTTICSTDYLQYLGFIYTIFACLRLAKFNIDTRQTVNFIGLNTPACCIFILGFYMQFFSEWQYSFNPEIFSYSKYFAIAVSFILAYLAVAEIEIFSLKGNPFNWKENKMRVLFLISIIPQAIFLEWIGLSTIILSYVFFAILHNSTQKN